MKSSLTPAESPKTFQPFTLHLTAETIEEARLLFHVCNYGRLLDLLKEHGTHYSLEKYNNDIALTISGNGNELLAAEITRQGFEI